MRSMYLKNSVFLFFALVLPKYLGHALLISLYIFMEFCLSFQMEKSSPFV